MICIALAGASGSSSSMTTSLATSALREELLRALTAWQRDHGQLPLCTQVCLNLADDLQLTGAMAEAGFDMVFIGIESPDGCGRWAGRPRQR